MLTEGAKNQADLGIHLGRRTHDRRLALGLSLNDVAKRLKKDATSMASCERGDETFTPDDLVALCDVLNVRPSWFFAAEDEDAVAGRGPLATDR